MQQSNEQRFVNLTDDLNSFFDFTNDNENWFEKNFYEAIDEYYHGQSTDLSTSYTTMTDLIGRVHSNDYFRNIQEASNLNFKTFMVTQGTSNMDFNERIDSNLIDIGTHASNISSLDQQYSNLNFTLTSVGIIGASGQTEMNLTTLNSNIEHNGSNIGHFNSKVESLFTSHFAGILDENTSHLNNDQLKTKIEGLEFVNLKIGDTTFNETTSRLDSLEAKSNISETNQSDFASYMTIDDSMTTVHKNTDFGNKLAIFDNVSQIRVGVNRSIVEEMNELYMPLNRPIEICFADGPCLKPCETSDGLCIDDNRIWDHGQASPPNNT
jgi:hypothetical protein